MEPGGLKVTIFAHACAFSALSRNAAKLFRNFFGLISIAIK